MPPHRLLLQAAEATKLAAFAGQKATEEAAKNGTAVPWFLFIITLITLGIVAYLLWKSEKGKAGEIQAARAKWAEEMAVNNGAADALQKQLREQYDKQIAQLIAEKKDMAQQILDGNSELRKQVAKDAQLFEALTNSQRITARTLQANNINQQEIMRVLGFGFPDANIRPPHSIDLL